MTHGPEEFPIGPRHQMTISGEVVDLPLCLARSQLGPLRIKRSCNDRAYLATMCRPEELPLPLPNGEHSMLSRIRTREPGNVPWLPMNMIISAVPSNSPLPGPGVGMMGSTTVRGRTAITGRRLRVPSTPTRRSSAPAAAISRMLMVGGSGSPSVASRIRGSDSSTSLS